MTTGCSSKFGSILRPRRIFSRGLFIFSDNFGAQKRVPKLGPKMGPGFGRTIRIVLTADFGAQFWGTKNASKNETQNQAKSHFFSKKNRKLSAQGSPGMLSFGPGLLGTEALQELQLASVRESRLFLLPEKPNAFRAYMHITHAGLTLAKKQACVRSQHHQSKIATATLEEKCVKPCSGLILGSQNGS